MIKSPFKPKNWLGAVVLLIIALGMMWVLKMCSHRGPNPLAVSIGHSGGDTLDVAIEMSPTCYMVHGDSVYGEAYLLLTDFSEHNKRPIKFHPFVPLDFALRGLDEGRFDIVVGSMPATAELRERYLVTQPVDTDREVLVQLRDSSGHGPVTEPSSLAGQEVWIAADSPFAGRIHNLSEEIGDTIFVHSDPRYSSEHLIILTALGELPRAVVNESLARKMQAQYPGLDISVPVSFTQFQSWILRRDRTALRDTINSWLRRNQLPPEL